MEASIVIVTYGQWAVTERCLRSLQIALGERLGRDWEIVVVDNNSPDETPQRLHEWSDRIRVELLPENRNFAGGCNRGAELARGDVLVFLNNDTEVPAGALETLVAQVHEAEVAIAGCRLLFPNGTAQHAGVAFIQGRGFANPMPQHVLHGQDGELAATQACFESDCVTAACMAVRADTFAEVDGFDERYGNGLEDVDLCLKIRIAGHRIVYRGDVTVVHHEGASRGGGSELWNTPAKMAAMRHNDEVFTARWGPQLDQDDALASVVWRARLRDQPPVRDGGGAAATVFGQPLGIGPAADEARAIAWLLSETVGQPAIYAVPSANLVADLSPAMAEILRRGECVQGAIDRPIIYVPGGPRDDFGGVALEGRSLLRLPQAETAVAGESAAELWVTTAALRSELVASGFPTQRVRVVPSPVIPSPAGSGGHGVLAVVPVHHPPLAAAVLEALSELPASTSVSLLPTVFRRGWERDAAAVLPRAEALRPCSDEAAFADMAAAADVVLAADPSDRFERRALVAAGVGATPITLDPRGPAVAALGTSTAAELAALALAIQRSVSEPRDRRELTQRIAATRADAVAALRALEASLTPSA
ncbi:MAG TPA: glycosyltransferase family 2 protein [Solirubrobacteraceae bacterium]|jgi:GT2 family glycosyltransferase|nr:glycosyltransferase family 2 protein [Solirubrobacteraceae bacterium]